jgi:hypothetical protein
MASLDNFYYHLQECKKMRATAENHEFIQTFATMLVDDRFDNEILTSCFIMFSNYVINNKYYNKNMFLCFTKLNCYYLNIYDCYNKFVQYGCLNTVIEYLKIFGNKISFIANSYCEINQNLTDFIITKYSTKISYNNLSLDIIFHGNVAMYHKFKSEIIKTLANKKYFYTKSTEMFHLIADDFPNIIVNPNQFIPNKYPISDESVIIKLLQINALDNNLYLQNECYRAHPKYREQIFSIMINNNFDIYKCMDMFTSCKNYEVAQQVVFYFLNQLDAEDLIIEFNKIFYDESYKIHKCISNFYNLVETSNIDSARIKVIKETIISNIKNLTFSSLLNIIDWSKKGKYLIYQDIFIEKTKNYAEKDWIEQIYYNLTQRNFYSYYEYRADNNIKTIIEAFYRGQSFFELFQIIVENKLPDSYVIAQIAESKISELDKYYAHNIITIVNDVMKKFLAN